MSLKQRELHKTIRVTRRLLWGVTPARCPICTAFLLYLLAGMDHDSITIDDKILINVACYQTPKQHPSFSQTKLDRHRVHSESNGTCVDNAGKHMMATGSTKTIILIFLHQSICSTQFTHYLKYMETRGFFFFGR